MTLDEAIIHAKEKADEMRISADLCNLGTEMQTECIKCAEQHEQLAEWLTHYQAIRQIVHEWGCDYAPINPDKKESIARKITLI